MMKSRVDHDARMRLVYTHIRAMIREGEKAPTQREIAESCGVSLSSVPRYLNALHRRGLIKWTTGKQHGIELIE